MLSLKLGKTPARRNAVTLRLADYLDTAVLPTPPAEFGHENLVATWGMLGNDTAGDCVFAGGAHETIMWNREGGKTVAFSTTNTLADYSAITGYDPTRPETDQGADMEAAAKYRRTTGLLDASGKRHKIGAYLALTPGDIQEHLAALYLFGAVGIGIDFPDSAMDQFHAGRPWSVVSGSRIEGGHYVPLVAKRTYLEVITWGKVQSMTAPFFSAYNDESIVYLSPEMLTGGMSPEGFNLAQLQADLAALGHAPAPAPPAPLDPVALGVALRADFDQLLRGRGL